MDQHKIIEAIKKNVIQGRRDKEDEGLEEGMVGEPGVVELVQEALEKGIDVKSILTEGLSAGMEDVGEKYEKGDYFIPDMLAAAEACGAAVDILEPYLAKQGGGAKGKFILATVEKDQHDIGKNIVGVMLKGAGFQVVDLGVDVPAEKIIAEVEKEGARFVGLSALLDTTMRYMARTVEKLRDKNLRDKVRVLIGGAPTSPEFASKIGADAHCKDAFAAVAVANKFAGGEA